MYRQRSLLAILWIVSTDGRKSRSQTRNFWILEAWSVQGSGLADCTLSIKYQYVVGRRLGIVSCLREQAVNKFSDLVTNAALLVSTVARTLRAESCPKSRVIAIPLPKPLTAARSEEHTSELQSQSNLVCRLLLEKKNSQSRTLTSWMYYCQWH